MTASAPERSGSPALRAAIALGVTALAVAIAVLVLGEAAYLWVKAAHVVAIISWMAGMLYLPRLFIYHCEAPAGSERSQMLQVMEHRLITIIINPAMALSWIFGLWLAWRGGLFVTGWFLAKLALVVCLSAVHGYFSVAVRRFALGRNTVSQRTWRILNEVPAVLMIGIVVLVIVRPF